MTYTSKLDEFGHVYAYEHELPDGRKAVLPRDKHNALMNSERYRRQDTNTLLHNWMVYGAFEPTAEDFAAYRARRDMLQDPTFRDAKTGYESVGTEQLFKDLKSMIEELAERSGTKVKGKTAMLEELARRISAGHVLFEKQAVEAEQNGRKAVDMIADANAKVDLAQKQMLKARELTDEAARREAILRLQIELAERKLAAMKEELPSVIEAAGRKLEL